MDFCSTECTARQATDRNITRHKRIARLTTEATDTHAECVTFIAFSLQELLHECALMQILFWTIFVKSNDVYYTLIYQKNCT